MEEKYEKALREIYEGGLALAELMGEPNRTRCVGKTLKTLLTNTLSPTSGDEIQGQGEYRNAIRKMWKGYEEKFTALRKKQEKTA